MTNAALLARFEVEHFDRNSIGEHRRAASLRILGRLAAVAAPRTLVELTPSDIMAWQSGEMARSNKPNSVRNYESMVHAFIRWAELAQLIATTDATLLRAVPPVRGATAKRLPRPYKRAEIQLLRTRLDEVFPVAPEKGIGMYALRRYKRGDSPFRLHARLHALRLQMEAQISLALEEGLRKGEIEAITLPRLHPDNECVVVRSLKTKPGEVREREVPYTEHSRACVRAWLEFRTGMMKPEHTRPWLSLHWEDPTDPQSWHQMVRAIEMLDCATEFRWHRLRHTFATERLRAGMPLEKVQLMMGHANLSQTLGYAQIVNSDLVTEADRTAEQFARNLGLEEVA